MHSSGFSLGTSMNLDQRIADVTVIAHLRLQDKTCAVIDLLAFLEASGS